MDFSNFEITMAVSDGDGLPIEKEDRTYGVAAFWLSYIPYVDPKTGGIKMNLLSKQIMMERCQLNRHFPNSTKLWAEEQSMDISYCVAPHQQLNISFPTGNPFFSQISFYMHKCFNNTLLGKTDCLPTYEIEKRLSNNYLALRFKDYYMNHSNFEQPGTEYINIQAMSVTHNVFKQLQLVMRNVEYITDEAYFDTSAVTKNYDSLMTLFERADFRTEDRYPGAFAACTFNMGYFKQTIKRRYYKFQNMLADLGGLLRGIITIALYINLFLSEKIFYNRIINANIHSFGGDVKNSQIKTENEKKLEMTKRTTNHKSSLSEIKQIRKKSSGHRQGEESHSNKILNKNGNNAVDSGTLHEAPAQNMRSGEGRTNRSDSKGKLGISEKLNTKILNSKKISVNNVTPCRPENTNRREVEMSCLAYIFPNFCFSKNSKHGKQLELHLKFKKAIDSQMDVITLLGKLHLVDKLNFVISGDRNKDLLTYANNPYLFNGEENTKTSEIYSTRKEILSTLKLFEN
jgi:hypothetical protein